MSTIPDTTNGEIAEEAQLQALFANRLAQLPKALQDAIQSAELESKLRAIAQRYSIHIDRGALLENEVKLTLFGFEKVENLAHSIEAEVEVDATTAQNIAEAISEEIFEPIRQQLERNLEHPDAHAAAVSGTEAARTQALDEAHAEAMTTAPAVSPATPPAPTPDVKITRPTEASAYKPGEPSHARASVHDDPYRESPA